MARRNNPTPAGYSVQFGYGTQPASKAQVYVDLAGNELQHTFKDIDGLFGSGGDALIGVNRTGIASGTTLNESIDSMVQAIVDNSGYSADLEYWFKRNTKSIVGMERNENWTAGGGTTLTEDVTYSLIGYQGVRLTEPDATASTMFATWSFNSIDLTKFNDSSVASDSDFIRFCFYISNSDAINTGSTGVSIIIATDPTAATNRWRVNITSFPAAYTGWAYADVQKSAFSNDGGTPDWSDIQSVRIAWASNNGYAGEYITFDDIWLCRKDPIEVVPNPFQREINGTFTRDFIIKDGYWYVGDGVVQGYLYMIDVKRTSSGYDSTPAALQGQVAYTDFRAEMVVFVETGSGGYTNMLTWEISDTQRVKAYMYNNLLYIYSHFETVEQTATTPFIAAIGELIVLTLEKHGSSITARVRNSNNYNIATVSLEVNTNSAGYLSVANNGTWTPIINLTITTTEYAALAGRAYMIGRYPWFSVVARDNASYDYYVDPVSGSDAYNGLAATGAFRTIQRLLLEPFAYTYVRNGIINIHLASGTYDEDITLPSLIGSGTMNWLGSATDATSVKVQKISANACNIYVTFQNMTLTASATAAYINKCNSIYAYNVQATANAGGADYGFQVFYSNLYAHSCLISNKNAAFKGQFPGTNIFIRDCTGTANTYSVYVTYAAMAMNMGGMPGSTTSSFAASGSHIYL